MADNPLWAHSLRNTKSTTSAQATGGSAPDPMTVDQHTVLQALRLTDRQRENIIGAWFPGYRVRL